MEFEPAADRGDEMTLSMILGGSKKLIKRQVSEEQGR